LDISGVDSAQLPLALVIGALVNGASWQSGPAGPKHHSDPFLPQSSWRTARASCDRRTERGDPVQRPTQLNFVVPPTAIPKASALFQISSGGNLLVATPLQIVDASPALFTVNNRNRAG